MEKFLKQVEAFFKLNSRDNVTLKVYEGSDVRGRIIVEDISTGSYTSYDAQPFGPFNTVWAKQRITEHFFAGPLYATVHFEKSAILMRFDATSRALMQKAKDITSNT